MKTLNVLREEFDSNLLYIEEDLLLKYARDETPGDYHFVPDFVFLPRNSREIVRLVKVAKKERIPIVPRGGGTSRCGGSLAVQGGVVLSLERMQKIIDIDERNLILEIQPGCITGNINGFLSEYNLFYPPDPASIDSCSIGGNVATNAGGPRCLRYGLTRNYVQGIEVILPDGSKEFFGGKLEKNATGYSLLNLFIGSEGTLGVITRILLKVIPIPPFSATLLTPFNSLKDATNAASKVLALGLVPSALEFMDEDSVCATIQNSEKKIPFKDKGTFLIALIEENSREDVLRMSEKMGEQFLEYGASDVFIAEEKYQQEKIWDFRRSISEALDHTGTIIPEDIVVPRSNLPIFVTYVKELEKKYDTAIYTFGHIGDGNIHINIIKREEWNDGGEKLITDVFNKVTSLGGRISGEHGIGFTKKRFLHFSRTEKEIELMKGIKRGFDPFNIMNPGKIFDLKGGI